MKLEIIDDRTIKVVLTTKDMEELSITYEGMDYTNPDTKKAISSIITKINKDLNINLEAGRLFVEAYPYADGGCILFVNSIVSSKIVKTNFDTPLIYAFKDINVLGNLINGSLNKFSHIISKNSLYYSKQCKEYYLIIYSFCKKELELNSLLSEYGKFYGKGAVAIALVKEHSDELISEDAIATCLNFL